MRVQGGRNKTFSHPLKCPHLAHYTQSNTRVPRFTARKIDFDKAEITNLQQTSVPSKSSIEEVQAWSPDS